MLNQYSSPFDLQFFSESETMSAILTFLFRVWTVLFGLREKIYCLTSSSVLFVPTSVKFCIHSFHNIYYYDYSEIFASKGSGRLFTQYISSVTILRLLTSIRHIYTLHLS